MGPTATPLSCKWSGRSYLRFPHPIYVYLPRTVSSPSVPVATWMGNTLCSAGTHRVCGTTWWTSLTYTLSSRVVGGMDVLAAMERVETTDQDEPKVAGMRCQGGC